MPHRATGWPTPKYSGLIFLEGGWRLYLIYRLHSKTTEQISNLQFQGFEIQPHPPIIHTATLTCCDKSLLSLPMQKKKNAGLRLRVAHKGVAFPRPRSRRVLHSKYARLRASPSPSYKTDYRSSLAANQDLFNQN